MKSYINLKDEISLTTLDKKCNRCNIFLYPWILQCKCGNKIDTQDEIIYKYGIHYRNNNMEAYKIIFQNIKKKNELLDVGCSYGSWYERFKQLGVKKIYGIDVNSNVLYKAKEKYDRAYNIDTNDILQYFDKMNLITANAVIEHILNDDEVYSFFKDIWNSLHANGIFIFTCWGVNTKNIQKRGNTSMDRPISYYKEKLSPFFNIKNIIGTIENKYSTIRTFKDISINEINEISLNTNRSDINKFIEVLFHCEKK